MTWPLYRVPTFRLNEAVKRNRKRLPPDFMFQLKKRELHNWRSHIAMSNPGAKMGLRRPPYAFTEHGVAMLSSVLHSDRKVAVNIAIVRTFMRLGQILATHRELAGRMEAELGEERPADPVKPEEDSAAHTEGSFEVIAESHPELRRAVQAERDDLDGVR